MGYMTRFWSRLAYWLPVKLIYWATIRMWAETTTGKWSNVDPHLDVNTMANRWDELHGDKSRWTHAMTDRLFAVKTGNLPDPGLATQESVMTVLARKFGIHAGDGDHGDR